MKLLEYDFKRKFKEISCFQTFRLKYITPATNFVYLCRKLWFHHQNKNKLRSKLYYLKICHKYNCYIFPDVEMGKGFQAFHPTGIVIGHSHIGENCMILQGVTIGEKNLGEYKTSRKCPIIGNNVTIGANACVLGDITISDNVVIGAGTVVTKNLESGIYAGVPAKRIGDSSYKMKR